MREGGIPGPGQMQRIVFNHRWDELRREPMLMDLKQRIRDVRQPGAAPSYAGRVSAQSANDPLRVTRDETMMVVVLFVEVMPIHNHRIDAVSPSRADATEAAS